MLKVDFVVYLGDPDEGATALPSAKVIDKIDEHKGKLDFANGVYGAITLEKNGKQLTEKKPDPVLKLVTRFVRAVPYVIDGEPETAVLSDSPLAFSFDPSGDDVMISFFEGDVSEPDEFLVENEATPIDAFSEQVIGMGERLVSMIKKVDPGLIESDDLVTQLVTELNGAKAKFKTFRLERERGVRR